MLTDHCQHMTHTHRILMLKTERHAFKYLTTKLGQYILSRTAERKRKYCQGNGIYLGIYISFNMVSSHLQREGVPLTDHTCIDVYLFVRGNCIT